MKNFKKHLIFLAFLLILFALSKLLSQEQLQNNETSRVLTQQLQNLCLELQTVYQLHSFIITTLFCLSFFLVTILYIPFTGSIYVLFAGALFGFYKGVILFSFLVSLSYTASFLISKHFFRQKIQKNIGKKGKQIIHEFEQSGFIYLLSIRFAGIIPAVLINTVMGITNVSLSQFYLTAQIGTFPHVVAMIYVGSQIMQIDNINKAMPDKFFLLIFILSLLPILLKMLAEFLLKRKNQH